MPPTRTPNGVITSDEALAHATNRLNESFNESRDSETHQSPFLDATAEGLPIFAAAPPSTPPRNQESRSDGMR